MEELCRTQRCMKPCTKTGFCKIHQAKRERYRAKQFIRMAKMVEYIEENRIVDIESIDELYHHPKD